MIAAAAHESVSTQQSTDAPSTVRRLLMVGPQGSGKGTQGTRVAGWLAILAISTGDVFRHHVLSKTALGLEVEEEIGRGHLVSDDLTERLVRDRLDQPDARNGFLLDGYPRNLTQLADLDQYLAGRGEALDAVVELHIPREESIRRLERRALQEGRDDDVDEVIAHRLDIYEQETVPVIRSYAERGILASVDGTGTRDGVAAAIQRALSGRELS